MHQEYHVLINTEQSIKDASHETNNKRKKNWHVASIKYISHHLCKPIRKVPFTTTNVVLFYYWRTIKYQCYCCYWYKWNSKHMKKSDDKVFRLKVTWTEQIVLNYKSNMKLLHQAYSYLQHTILYVDRIWKTSDIEIWFYLKWVPFRIVVTNYRNRTSYTPTVKRSRKLRDYCTYQNPVFRELYHWRGTI